MASPASKNQPMSIITDFTISPAEMCCENVDLIDTGRGEIVCKNCGLVHEREIKGQGRVAYTWEEVNSRSTSAPISNSKPRIVLSKNGKHVVKDSERWLRLSRVNAQKMDRLKHNYYNKVRSDCQILGLPWHVAETAVRIFAGCLKAGNLRGRSVVGMSKASIYYACIVNRVPISVKSLWKDTISRDKFRPSLKFAKQVVDDVYGKKDIGDKKSRLSSRIMFFCNLIEAGANRASMDNVKCINVAKEIYTKIAAEKEGRVLDGKSPGTIIAALLYITASIMGSHVTVMHDGKEEYHQATQKWIAEGTSNVTEVSLRTRAKEIAAAALKIKKRTGLSVHPVIDEFAMKFKVKTA